MSLQDGLNEIKKKESGGDASHQPRKRKVARKESKNRGRQVGHKPHQVSSMWLKDARG